MKWRRPALTRWSLVAITIAVVSAGSVGLFGALELEWPAWVVPTLVAGLGTLVAVTSSWAEAELSSVFEHQKLRRDQRIRGEIAFQVELGGRKEPARVKDADPLRLGVHAAVNDSLQKGQLPTYVERDFDRELDSLLELGFSAGVFILLLGNSSVGKTRAAYESVKRIVPDWAIIQPRKSESIVTMAESGEWPSKSVIWLDEIQYYLNESTPVTAATIRGLLDSGRPVIIIGTIWPSVYASYVDTTKPASVDTIPRNELLKLAYILAVDDQFSSTELRRAERIRTNDSRVDAALRSTDFGVTQVLAAAPELMRRWKSAPDPYSRALLTAAIDARRLGLQHPLSIELLESACPAYLTSMERARAPSDWFERSLSYATSAVRGATAALVPVAGGMGETQGYIIADYLLEQGSKARGKIIPEQEAWDAFVDYTSDVEDLLSLGRSAENRRRLRLASSIFQVGIQRGIDGAFVLMAGIAEATGQIDEAEKVLREGVGRGLASARSALAYQLQKSGRIEEEEALRRVAVVEGDQFAHRQLAELLHRSGRTIEAERILRARIDAGDTDAENYMATIAKDKGDIDEAERILRSLISRDLDNVHDFHRVYLAEILEKRGQLSEAEDMLRSSLAHGEMLGRHFLAEFLTRHGKTDELEQLWREGVASGRDPLAKFWLGHILRKAGRESEFFELANDTEAVVSLSIGPMLADFYQTKGEPVMAEQIWLDSINRGDSFAAILYTSHLEESGRRNDSENYAKYGLSIDGTISLPWW